MYFFLILVAALGFAAWAFFQNMFVNTPVNANDETRLLFPMVVPILAGIMVSVGYVIWLKNFPGPFLIASLKVTQNLVVLIGASVGLALAYFLYTLLISINSKSIALIPIFTTLLMILIALFVVYKDGHFERPKPTLIEITGAGMTIVGAVIFKFGDQFWKKWMG